MKAWQSQYRRVSIIEAEPLRRHAQGGGLDLLHQQGAGVSNACQGGRPTVSVLRAPSSRFQSPKFGFELCLAPRHPRIVPLS